MLVRLYPSSSSSVSKITAFKRSPKGRVESVSLAGYTRYVRCGA